MLHFKDKYTFPCQWHFSVFVVAVWEGCLLAGELFTLTGLFLKIFFSHIFAGYNNIINFLLPARLRILKGIFFPLNITQDIDITAAYNISLASMLREMRWKFLERFCTMYKISESYSETCTDYTLSFNHIMIMAK